MREDIDSTNQSSSIDSVLEWPPQQEWQSGQVLGEAWAIVKKRWMALLLGGLLYYGITTCLELAVSSAVAALADSALADSALAAGWPWTPTHRLAAEFAGKLLLTSPVYVCGLRFLLAIVRGEPISIERIGGILRRAPTAIAVQVLTAAVVLFGLALFIVPGVMVWTGLLFSPYFVADTKRGPVDALRASWRATDGHKGQIFGFGLTCGALLLGGLLFLGVGLIPAAAVVAVGQTILYVRLSGRGSVVSAESLHSWDVPDDIGEQPLAAKSSEAIG